MAYTLTDSHEEALRGRWQGGDVAELVTRDGERLRVVYRGRGNRGAGPDFRDVVLATPSAELWKGDLEVDRRSSLWWAHGHHQDPAYNRVVLHLVGHDDARRRPRRPDGAAVAVACLRDALERGKSAVEVGSCPLPPGEAVGAVLDRLGKERFEDKVARFKAALNQKPPADVLYQGLMEALGYPENREAFRRLARALPLAMVEGFLRGKPPEQAATWAEALLLGAGGLRAEASPQGGLWASLASSGDEAIAWRWAGGRPFNHPRRRLQGMARLLGQHQGSGLLAALAQALGVGQPRALEATLVVADEGQPAFIGGERAREMVINVVLPLFAAGGERSSGKEKAKALYATYPPGGSNALLRQMAGQLGPGLRPWLKTACRQQGLLHLYRHFCTQGQCHRCPWTEGGLHDIIDYEDRTKPKRPFPWELDLRNYRIEEGGSSWAGRLA